MKKQRKIKKKEKRIITREHLFLFLLFVIVLGARLFFTLQEESFTYDAYDALRQADNIKKTGVPLFKDELSYSGRTLIFPPFFYYLLAGFSFIIPLALAAKLIPSIGFAALVIVVYFIAKHITKNKIAAFVAALFSGFVPIFYTTLNHVSVYSLSLVLIFLLSYVFLRIQEKGFPAISIILTILLLFTHASIFIILFSFIVYFIIIRLEKQKLIAREVEVILFLVFLALWFNLLLYKKAFFIHGISFIWQNLPAPLLSSYFMDISFLGVIYAVGLIPLLLGVYTIYHVLFKTMNKAVTLYISFTLVSFIMLWLKLVPFRSGLLFLSINLIILSAYSIKIIFVSLAKTKIPRLSVIFPLVIVVLFALTTITPFISNISISKPPAQDIQALEWIKENTHEGDVVLGRIEEGFLISYVSDRKNVADSNFLFISNIDQRYDDINRIFTSRLKSEAIRLINKYDIDYIFLSTQSMKEYNITQLYYAGEECFDLVYDNEARIYELFTCELDETI